MPDAHKGIGHKLRLLSICRIVELSNLAVSCHEYLLVGYYLGFL